VVTWIWLSAYCEPRTDSFLLRFQQLPRGVSAVRGLTHILNRIIDRSLDRLSITSRLTRISIAFSLVLVSLWALAFFPQFSLRGRSLRLRKLITTPSLPVDQRYICFLRCRKKDGHSKNTALIESALVEVPTVIGCIKPVILVPVTFLTALPPIR